MPQNWWELFPEVLPSPAARPYPLPGPGALTPGDATGLRPDPLFGAPRLGQTQGGGFDPSYLSGAPMPGQFPGDPPNQAPPLGYPQPPFAGDRAVPLSDRRLAAEQAAAVIRDRADPRAVRAPPNQVRTDNTDFDPSDLFSNLLSGGRQGPLGGHPANSTLVPPVRTQPTAQRIQIARTGSQSAIAPGVRSYQDQLSGTRLSLPSGLSYPFAPAGAMGQTAPSTQPNSVAPRSPPGASAFRQQLEDEINTGRFRDGAAASAYAHELAQQLGNPELADWTDRGGGLDRAVTFTHHGGRVRVDPLIYPPSPALPLPPPSPPSRPDISAERGTNYELNITPIMGGPTLNISTEGVGAAIRSVANQASAGLADPLAAVYDTYLGRGGSYAENLARQEEFDRYNEEHHPWMHYGGEILGVLATPEVEGANLATRAAIGAGRGFTHGFATTQGGFGDRLRGGVLDALAVGVGPIATDATNQIIRGVGPLRRRISQLRALAHRYPELAEGASKLQENYTSELIRYLLPPDRSSIPNNIPPPNNSSIPIERFTLR